MLQIIIFKKYALQVVDSGVDGPAGGVLQPSVVAPHGSDGLDVHEHFFKVRIVFVYSQTWRKN